jgi:hypothetical protein
MSAYGFTHVVALAFDLSLSALLVWCALMLVFSAGVLFGRVLEQGVHHPDAGDTHAHLPPLAPMRAADRQRMSGELAAALEAAEVVRRQRLRAGSKPLKPSFDSRRARG